MRVIHARKRPLDQGGYKDMVCGLDACDEFDELDEYSFSDAYVHDSGGDYTDEMTGVTLLRDDVAQARMYDMKWYEKILTFEEVPDERCVLRTEREPISCRWRDIDRGDCERVIRRAAHTHSVSHGHCLHFIPCVTYRRTLTAQGVCSASMSYLSISPFPLSCFIRRPSCSRTVTSTRCSRLHLPCRTFPDPKARVKRTSERAARSFGYLADPTHSTSSEPKEFDKITSADGDTTPINDPNYDNISDFSKITREDNDLLGVPSMFEACFVRFSW